MIEEKARFGAGHQLFEFLHAERSIQGSRHPRPSGDEGRHLMRFGSQSHVTTLFECVADVLRQEMG
jgi:hypothetical protein